MARPGEPVLAPPSLAPSLGVPVAPAGRLREPRLELIAHDGPRLQWSEAALRTPEPLPKHPFPGVLYSEQLGFLAGWVWGRLQEELFILGTGVSCFCSFFFPLWPNGFEERYPAKEPAGLWSVVTLLSN